MKILIVSATFSEIEPFWNKWSKSAFSGSLSSFTVNNCTVDVLVTGVGMVATSYVLTRQLVAANYNLVLNAGIAGVLNKNIPLGEVFLVEDDAFYELGAEDNQQFINAFELGLMKKNEHPFSDGKLLFKNTFCNYINAIPRISGITVSRVHGSRSSIEELLKTHEHAVESMEGAAFMYVCLMENVCFAQVRAVSNYIEPRNKASWQIPLAINKLNETLTNIINTVTA